MTPLDPTTRAWIDDAADRLQRDEGERDENDASVTSDELVDALWGRLPVAVRRSLKRDDFPDLAFAVMSERGDNAAESAVWDLGLDGDAR